MILTDADICVLTLKFAVKPEIFYYLAEEYDSLIHTIFSVRFAARQRIYRKLDNNYFVHGMHYSGGITYDTIIIENNYEIIRLSEIVEFLENHAVN